MSQFDNEHRARLSPLRRRVHKTLGVRLFSPAPDDFNPIEATDRELQVHGYPARPDPNLWPELHQRWQRVFSLPLSMIEPQFAVMPPMSRPPIRPEMPQAGVSGSANWSGSIAKLKEGSKAAFVTGEWTVPDIATPGSLAYSSAIWVGIDGSDDQQPGPVQAGTTIGRLTGSRDTFAWYEWVPEGPVCISNFPVSSGDVVICTLCANSPTEAAFYLLNETRRIGTSLIKTVPDGAKEMDFSTAEWILEHPMNTTPPSQLAPYGKVYFSGYAGTPDGEAFLPGLSDLVVMDFYSTESPPITLAIPISQPSVVTDELILLTYTGWDVLTDLLEP